MEATTSILGFLRISLKLVLLFGVEAAAGPAFTLSEVLAHTSLVCFPLYLVRPFALSSAVEGPTIRPAEAMRKVGAVVVSRGTFFFHTTMEAVAAGVAQFNASR